jgi:uncharacterized membrane protein YozB (DUF420 family)
MDLSFLPSINASLNACAAVLLIAGRRFIKLGRIDAHRRTMLAAFGVSSVFLVFYVAHKASRDFENTTFGAEGVVKAAYLVLLTSHVLLAITVPVLAVLLIRFGLKGEIAQHRGLAKWAWPIWMYVSLSGVVIYFLLYHWNPTLG